MDKILADFFKWFGNLVRPLTESYIYWGVVIIGAIILTIALKFIQIRRIKHLASNTFKKYDGQSSNGISPFMTAMLAVGGRVGPGNVIGVTVALTQGGTGALFWFWLVAFFGIGLAYGESLLGQLFKKKNERTSTYMGGPSLYMNEIDGIIEANIDKRSKWNFLKKLKIGKKMALTYAVVSVIGFSFFIPMLQASFVIDGAGLVINQDFNVTTPGVLEWMITAVIAIILLVLLIFGVEAIIKLAGSLVPFMVMAFFLVTFFILFKNINYVGGFFISVFSEAFDPKTIAAGGVGATLSIVIQSGVTRGLFATESGSGTGAIAGAAAEVDHPARVAHSQSFAIFFVMLIATLTGFTIYASGVYVSDNSGISAIGIAGKGFGLASFGEDFGKYFVPIIMFFFAFTSLIAVSTYAISAISYFTENQSKKKQVVWSWIIKTSLVLSVILTPIILAIDDNVFMFVDVVLAVQLIFNVVALLIFLPIIKKVSKDFEKQTEKSWSNKTTFNPNKLKVPASDAWTKKSAALVTDSNLKK